VITFATYIAADVVVSFFAVTYAVVTDLLFQWRLYDNFICTRPNVCELTLYQLEQLSHNEHLTVVCTVLHRDCDIILSVSVSAFGRKSNLLLVNL